MKLPVYLVSALAGMLLHIPSSTAMGAVAREEGSEVERIVGGEDAGEGQFPWAVALFRNNSFICTGSIIGPTTVLTAAHCVVTNGRTEPAGIFHAIANVRKSSPTVRIDFASITPHPNYTESGILNDIALFRTTDTIPFGDTVERICIADNSTGALEYKNVVAMGWGDTQRFRVIAIIPDNLQFVQQKVVSNRACRLAYFGRPLEDYKICAGDLLSGICSGDSGGPLVLMGDNPVQIGVASYGNAITGCGFLTPSVWTRVSSFNGFIQEVAEGDDICVV